MLWCLSRYITTKNSLLFFTILGAGGVTSFAMSQLSDTQVRKPAEPFELGLGATVGSAVNSGATAPSAGASVSSVGVDTRAQAHAWPSLRVGKSARMLGLV